MTWFVDRDVCTVFLPYGTVPELEHFARVQGVDGILVCLEKEHELQPFFRVMPYRTAEELDRAMKKSSLFGPVRVEGGWRWYPVRCPSGVELQP